MTQEQTLYPWLRRRALPVGALAASLVAFPFLASAQFGGVVFDPTVTAKIILETAKIAEQVNHTIQIEQHALSTYQTLVNDARMLASRNPLKGYWRSVLLNCRTPNQSGGTGDWASDINRGLNSVDTWARTASGAYYHPSLLVADYYRKTAAAAEIRQGAATNAMETLGQIRTSQAQMENSITACEDLTQDTSGSSNTRGTLQNIQNSCTALALRQTQSHMALAAADTDLRISQTLAETNRENTVLNRQSGIRYYQENEPTALQFHPDSFLKPLP